MKRRLSVLLGLLLVSPVLGWCSNRAGIVIRDSTGEVITRCVEFEEESISLETLLQRSGFKLMTSRDGAGVRVCYLHDDGSTDEGQCLSNARGERWNLFVQTGEGWAATESTVDAVSVQDGTLFGFHFGTPSTADLPPLTYDDVCGYTSTAVLVVDHSNGERRIVWVIFPGETLTGLQLLRNSELPLITNDYSFGTAICAIDNEGQPAGDCFNDPQFRYWGLNLLENDRWVASMVGAADVIVRNGDVHGYFFGAWGSEQPPISSDAIFGLPSSVSNWQWLKN